jgi:hypothetical protein
MVRKRPAEVLIAQGWTVGRGLPGDWGDGGQLFSLCLPE